MALSDWSERQLLGLTAGVVGGILAVMAGLIAYIYLAYMKLGEEIAGLKRQNRTLQDKADTLEDRRKVYDNYIQKVEEDAKRLPDDKQVEELSNQVLEQVRNAQLRVTTLVEEAAERGRGRGARGQAAVRSAAKYTPVKMKMEASGQFHQFGRFLSKLENRLQRIVAVKQFEITGDNDGLVLKQPKVDIRLQFEAYHYKGAPGKGTPREGP